ncbi:MAG: hypothetical protein O7C75_05225 [Verrucomicrobia bacterium]|nr:hypothetical protein [Verrucomicrobiota bacterium]
MDRYFTFERPGDEGVEEVPASFGGAEGGAVGSEETYVVPRVNKAGK